MEWEEGKSQGPQGREAPFPEMGRRVGERTATAWRSPVNYQNQAGAA